jgi:hypothetical protein
MVQTFRNCHNYENHTCPKREEILEEFAKHLVTEITDEQRLQNTQRNHWEEDEIARKFCEHCEEFILKSGL